MPLRDVASLQLVAVETVCRVLDKARTASTFGNTVVQRLSADAQTTVNNKWQRGNDKVRRVRDSSERGRAERPAGTQMHRHLSRGQLGPDALFLDLFSLRSERLLQFGLHKAVFLLVEGVELPEVLGDQLV